jgi:tight adherence protein B
MLAAGGIFLFFFGLYTSLASVPSVEDRLRRYSGEEEVRRRRLRGGAPSAAAMSRRMSEGLARGRYGSNIARDLSRADLKLTAGEFITITMVSTFVMLVIGFVLLGRPLVGILLAVLGFFAPNLWLRFMKARRIRQFNGQLADAIGLLASSMRSGYSLPQAMDLLVRDGRPPISVEFARVNREIGLGLSANEALMNMLERVPSEDLDLMITAINIQRDVGGNLAEVLDSIAETIRDRVKLKGEIVVLTSQQSISGYIISALPVLLGGVLFLLNPTYMSRLVTTIVGWIMLGCAAFGIMAGFFVMKRITDIKI